MVVYHKYSKRKVSGGRYVHPKGKKQSNVGSLPTFTKIEETKIKVKREKGGSAKPVLLASNKINVTDPKTKKTKVTEIVTAIENKANRNFVRRNIITKGTILETKLGKVRITSRPGQEGAINGVLIS